MLKLLLTVFSFMLINISSLFSTLYIETGYDLLLLNRGPTIPTERWPDTLSDEGLALGFIRIDNKFIPQAWTIDGRKIEYFIPDPNELNKIYHHNFFEKRANFFVNSLDEFIMQDKQYVHVFLPGNQPHIIINLQGEKDRVVGFDDEGYIYARGKAPYNAYRQHLSDLNGERREPIAKSLALDLDKIQTFKTNLQADGSQYAKALNPKIYPWKLIGVYDVNKKGQILVQAQNNSNSPVLVVILDPEK